MHSKRLTFFLGADGLPSWLIKSIHNQLIDFDGSVTLLKIQTLQEVNVKDYLDAMTLAFQPFDLCQLILCGPKMDDFERRLNQCLPDNCFIVDKNTSTAPTHLNFDTFHFQFCHIEKQLNAFNRFVQSVSQPTESSVNEKEKTYVLKWLAKQANYANREIIETQLKQRESMSSTGMKNGIAFPHIVSEGVTDPQLFCVTTTTPIQWGSNFGPVTHIMCLILPKPFQKEAFLGVKNLASKLVNEDFQQFITQQNTGAELQVILSCLMEQR
ncbi:PTS sugar transporter subunit IIA [Vibrio rumoiensis]|uniref:PTS EIIA type-2 domain-containing protein n=1 Tax=Vibrio rumoiensis 1S-45 TaxID=1188252 RepID=A0A1E5DZG0_9VIBR|nr:PTS sugar transporter subunit IIA [Vibrio rumoiensis]OEF23267.1 hypothetical protein A1QC_12240 [Vibrio rumoiensis 1S-45]